MTRSRTGSLFLRSCRTFICYSPPAFTGAFPDPIPVLTPFPFVLQGQIAAVNASLAAGVTYLGNLNFHGTDTLSIVADDLGNTGSGGALTDSESVSIHVFSPSEQIAQLQVAVQNLNSQGALNNGQTNSLLKKLENALDLLDKGKTKVAYNMVGAFKNEVQALTSAGVLTPAQGLALLTTADLLSLSLQIGGGF